MSQNGQTHFKNLAANADHFGTLCIKGLKFVIHLWITLEEANKYDAELPNWVQQI